MLSSLQCCPLFVFFSDAFLSVDALQASTLETAEVAHAAALDDAVSRERTNAAQAHAVQAATIAQQVKKQARELAEKEVESRVAEAVESVEGMAAEEVAALRDQHAKVRLILVSRLILCASCLPRDWNIGITISCLN